MNLQQLPDTELKALAQTWRTQALRGLHEARAAAHLCEIELRRRACSGFHARLDVHPLQGHVEAKRW